MPLYHKLNLPQWPLVKSKIPQLIGIKLKGGYDTVIQNVDEYINPEILDIFAQLGHKPVFFVFFGQPQGPVGQTTVHTDVLAQDGKIHILPFGINWELTPGNTVWHWWNIGTATEFEPNDTAKKNLLTGITYDYPNNKDTDKFTLIDTTQTAGQLPMLVNTGLPHSVKYTSISQRRVCISLRFNLDEISSFEQASKIFSPLFLNNN